MHFRALVLAAIALANVSLAAPTATTESAEPDVYSPTGARTIWYRQSTEPIWEGDSKVADAELKEGRHVPRDGGRDVYENVDNSDGGDRTVPRSEYRYVPRGEGHHVPKDVSESDGGDPYVPRAQPSIWYRQSTEPIWEGDSQVADAELKEGRHTPRDGGHDVYYRDVANSDGGGRTVPRSEDRYVSREEDRHVPKDVSP
ncbi:hypothetical protein BD413DRAFT_40506 [Trametes elegans]|nr:hypothetical protein BD413DRAFT_40506 [Trametes elegans]